MNNHRRNPGALGTVTKAGAVYFALVFGVGFLLGSVRVPFLVPRLGERWAELVEIPLMAVAICFAARYVVRRFSLSLHPASRLLAGGLALALLVAAELGLAVLLQSRSLAEYISSRDPVSGGVYLAMLVLFAIAPWLLPTQHGRLSQAASREAVRLPSDHS